MLPRLMLLGLLVVSVGALPASAAVLKEVPDDEIIWCTLEFNGGLELRAPKGSGAANPLQIVLREVADAQPASELFLEFEFDRLETRSYTGAVDEHDEVPVFEAPRSLLSDLTKFSHWTYRLDQRQSVAVDEQLPDDLLKGFERCAVQSR